MTAHDKLKNPRPVLPPPRTSCTLPGDQKADESRVHAPGTTLTSNAQ